MWGFAEVEGLPDQVRGNLEVLRGACDQLTGCGDFMVLLQAVLSLGNHLNEGTMRGAASGEPQIYQLQTLRFGFTGLAGSERKVAQLAQCAQRCNAHLWPKFPWPMPITG